MVVKKVKWKIAITYGSNPHGCWGKQEPFDQSFHIRDQTTKRKPPGVTGTAQTNGNQKLSTGFHNPASLGLWERNTVTPVKRGTERTAKKKENEPKSKNKVPKGVDNNEGVRSQT